MYREEYAERDVDVDDEAIDEAVNEFSKEELEAYQKYQEDLAKYYEEMEAYEAEQEALAAWERDNAEEQRKEKERKKREEKERLKREERQKKGPPPLPPRRLQEAAVEAEKEVKVTSKAVQEAVSNYSDAKRSSKARHHDNDQKAKLHDAKKAVRKAQAEAEQAAQERDRIKAELDAATSAASKPSVASSAAKRISKTLGRGKPAAPPLPPREEEKFDIPPPPPPLPTTPEPPKPPALPSIGPDLGDITTVKLRKASVVNDRSKPQVKKKESTLVRQIKKGVELKAQKPPASHKSSKALPDLKEMKPNQQNLLMQKLIETMNERRGALTNDEDSDDEWSD